MKNTERGFTLVELAVVMLVAGLLLAAAMQTYDVNLGDKARRETLDNIESVKSAVALFHAAHDRYPCPARLDLPLGHADYGKEIDCSGSLPVTPGAGVTRTTGRDADNIVGGDGILIGGVPFVTLELSPNEFGVNETVKMDLSSQQILDGWKNKLTYAVSENLVQTATFNADLGAISVEDEFGTVGGRNPSLVDPPGSVHFVVLSHGDNGRGAYTQNGVLVGNPCTGGAVTLPPPAPPGPPLSSGTTIEYENCNNDDLFISALKNDVIGNSYNDDITGFEVFVSADLWEFAPGTTFPGSIRNKNAGNVYIGTPAVLPDPDNARLNVAGKVKAVQSISARLCSETGDDDCFEPGLIAGDGNHAKDTDRPDPTGKRGMSCSDSSEAMTGIQEGRPNCASPFASFGSSLTDTCPGGKYMIGIKSNGTLDCENFYSNSK